MKTSLGIFFLLIFWLNGFANVSLPAIFSDHMVLQRNADVKFWGWADPGEKVTVVVDWQSNENSMITDASGKWSLSLQTTSAGGPHNIIIKGKNELHIHDVLMGEVWVCSGQSNMVFSLKSSYQAEAAIAKANYPSIRYCSVERQYGPQPFKDAPGSVWKQTTPQTAPDYSAVAYFFAKKIHETLKVPVGIVYAAWGGTPAEAWTPPSVIKNDDSLSRYIDRWKYIQENKDKDSQALYYFKRPWREPGVLFNGMINPVIPFTIKGFLWYQGESNVGYPGEYEHLLTEMIKSWRKKWSDDDLPFYIVQIASYGYKRLEEAAILRQGQYNVSKKVNHSGLAVTIDVGDMHNIHYTHKQEVGDRLALIALAKDYGFKKLVYEGPELKAVKVKHGKLHLKFNQRLFAYNKKTPAGFEIGFESPEKDSLVFAGAKVLIKGKELMIWNENVKKPLLVRYAWLKTGAANIVNKEGLPAPPFQKKL